MDNTIKIILTVISLWAVMRIVVGLLNVRYENKLRHAKIRLIRDWRNEECQ